MPRDYSRNKNDRSADRRDYRRNNSAGSSSGFTWLLIGILVGLSIAGIAYLNQSRNHNNVEANLNSQQQVAANRPASATNAKKNNTNNPQFDFYNMLPSSQVSTPTATDQTTSDNVTHPSPPPNPAKVNAILSGVTPPPANANSSNNTNTDNSNANGNAKATTASQPISANTVDDNGDIVSVPKNTGNASSTPSTTAQPKNNNAQQITAKPLTNTSPNSNSAYIIQLAAFLHYQQADQFKAQLALSGYEAKIVAFQKNGKTLQRVWIGPYPTLAAAAAVQRQLATNQIKSTLLRVNAQ